MTDSPHYVTPEDAKYMKCPMSFSAVTKDDEHYICLGPKCMAWRWKEKADWKEGSDFLVTYSETHGYCGMVRT